jgi:hypothetical protein
VPELFRRAYALTVDQLRIVDLDIAFTVFRTLQPEPNTAEITIRNLHPDNRKRMEEKRHVIVNLEAGYKPPGETSLIFAGDLREVHTHREGPDLLTVLSSGDGEEQHRKARVNRSFPPGTSLRRVIEAAAEAMGVGVGNLTALSQVEFPGAGAIFPGGTVLSGNVAEELRALLRSAGLEYSIQAGVMQILTRNKALEGSALVLSSDSGMVGTPSASSDGTARASLLMAPDVFPGRKVEFRSENLVGVYRVETATYHGDTAGQDWTIDVECTPLKGATVIFPT